MKAGDRVYLGTRPGIVVSARRSVTVIAVWSYNVQRPVRMTVTTARLKLRDGFSANEAALSRAAKS